MRKHTLFIPWIIIGITFPLLGTLAWNQFNWLQELRNREQRRIKFSMTNSAQVLTARVQEEILFLPSMLQIRPQDNTEIEKMFIQRFHFWQYYCLFPEMVSHVFLIDPDTKVLTELGQDGFIIASDPVLAEEIRTSFGENNFEGSKIEDTEKEIRIIMPMIGSKKSRNIVLCVFDKSILFRDVIPAIAKKSFESTNLYAYRIVDTRSNTVIFDSLPNDNENAFKNPDIEISVFDKLHLPSFRQPPDFFTERIPDGYVETFSFIKERTKIDMPVSPDQNQSRAFSFLVLQIVNRDGSLAKLSKQATVQNAIISFGTVILLTLVMIVLVEATRRSRSLAVKQQEFIATITHELKTPLAVISSASQNLTDGLVRDQKKVEQYGSVIKKEALRLTVSIEHFLLYSNTNSLSKLRVTYCEVADLVQTALKFTEEERQRHDFRTEIILPEGPVYIRGDKIALESVFQNITQNVIIHAKEGKYLGIIVSLEESSQKHRKSFVTIKFRDKGPGISSSEQKLIFEPFTRGKRAVEGQIPGNGIGLNLVKRIVTVHGGTVMIESKLSYGCTFIIKLPASKGENDGQ